MVNTIHPMLVHFPIALIFVTAIIALIDLLNSKYQLKKIVLWNLCFASITTVLTVISGFKDANVIPHNETIHAIIEIHEKIGVAIQIISTILAIWLLLRISKISKTENILFVLVLWFTLALTAYNGYLGGKMVYDNGAGIKPMQKAFQLEDHDHDE